MHTATVMLSCSDTVKKCKIMTDASYELIKKSPHRDAALQKLKEQIPDGR